MLKTTVNAIAYVSLVLGSSSLLLLLVKMWYKLSTGECKSKRMLYGKTVLVTGANRGIGKATAMDLARRKARVILACRSVDKANEAAEEIKRKTGNTNVVVAEIDLSSLKSVREFCRNILETEDRLDVLINNAAMVAETAGKLNEDGLELHYATNYFGPFLLTMLLLPLLQRSAPARIVNVSSILHFWGTIDLNDVFGRGLSTGPIGMYSNTKLAQILFTRTLSKKLIGVTVNSLHPGNTETDIANHCPRWMFVFAPLVKFLVLKSVEEGAQTSIYAAVSEDLDGVSGQYLADCGRAMSSPSSKDDSLMDWLWVFSHKITGLTVDKME